MPTRGTDTHTVTLVDLPLLVRRLNEKGMCLDSEIGLTREVGGPHNVLISSLLLPHRTLHTLVAKCDKQQVLGLFRLKPDDHHAHIVYIAPRLEPGMEDTVWLHILDAMAVEAGKRGAHILAAEVDEQSRLFQTMRNAGFAVYARQDIWQRPPGKAAPATSGEQVRLSVETDADAAEIQLLYCNIVPRLVQQAALPPGDSQGLVYRKAGRIEGYIALTEGKNGVYLMPYLHPDIFGEAPAVIAAAIAHSSRAEKVPVYVCVRRYQDWLEEAMVVLNFMCWAQQAVMVKHIAAGIRQAAFEPLRHKLEAMPSPIRPPTSQIKTVIKISEQESCNFQSWNDELPTILTN